MLQIFSEQVVAKCPRYDQHGKFDKLQISNSKIDGLSFMIMLDFPDI